MRPVDRGHDFPKDLQLVSGRLGTQLSFDFRFWSLPLAPLLLNKKGSCHPHFARMSLCTPVSGAHLPASSMRVLVHLLVHSVSAPVEHDSVGGREKSHQGSCFRGDSGDFIFLKTEGSSVPPEV